MHQDPLNDRDHGPGEAIAGLPPDAGADADAADEPWGAQVVRRLHADKTHLMRDYDDLMGPLEQAEVRKLLERILADHERHLTEAERLFGKYYGHLSPLADALDEKDLPPEGDEGEFAEEEFAEGEEEAAEGEELPEELAEGEEVPEDEEVPEEDGADAAVPRGGLPGAADEALAAAVPADSVEDDSRDGDEPTEDEAVVGMERAREEAEGRRGAKAANLYSRPNPADARASAPPPQRRGVATPAPTSSPRPPRPRAGKALGAKALNGRTLARGAKALPCKSCGRAACKCAKAAPGTEAWLEEEAREPQHRERFTDEDEFDEDEFDERDRLAIGGGRDFLGEIAEPESLFEDEHRMKAYHFHKTFEGMASLDKAHRDLAQTPPASDVPPADFKPGVGAKDAAAPARPAASGAASGAGGGGTGAYHKVAPAVAAMAPEIIGAVAATSAASQGGEKRARLGEVGAFFKAIAFERNFGDPHREKALAYHKELGEMCKAWAPHPDWDDMPEDQRRSVEESEKIWEDMGAPKECPDDIEDCDVEPGAMDAKSLRGVFNDQQKALNELQQKLSALPL